MPGAFHKKCETHRRRNAPGGRRGRPLAGPDARAAAAVINATEEAANVAELRAKGCAVYTDYQEMLRAHAGRVFTVASGPVSVAFIVRSDGSLASFEPRLPFEP